MRIDPTEHPILVTEPAWNSPENRERMAEIMFEEFNVPAFYIANTGVLNAYVALAYKGVVIMILSQICSREGIRTCHRHWPEYGLCDARCRWLCVEER